MITEVDYELVDKAHFFTSKEIKGLCLAHIDKEVALKSVPYALEVLLEYNYNKIGKVVSISKLDEITNKGYWKFIEDSNS